MPSFEWKGRTRAGGTQEGVLLADSRDAAVAVLRRQQIQVVNIREKGREFKLLPRMPTNVSRKRIAIFTRQFSVMLDAGLPLVQCLEILGSQQEHKVFKRTLLQVRQDVESGSNLADAMRKHPKVFNDLFTNMVAAGEAGGILDTILQRLSTYIEKSVKLNSQVKSAMIYPVAVISIACIVVAVILWKVIPVFASGGWWPSWASRWCSDSASTTRPTGESASSTASCSRRPCWACSCARSPWPVSAARSRR